MFASDEDIDADSEPFACEACPLADALADLEQDTANHEAWGLFRQVFNRLTFDAHCAGVVFDRVIGERDPVACADLLERFQIIYDALNPQKDAPKEWPCLT